MLSLYILYRLNTACKDCRYGKCAKRKALKNKGIYLGIVNKVRLFPSMPQYFIYSDFLKRTLSECACTKAKLCIYKICFALFNAELALLSS